MAAIRQATGADVPAIARYLAKAFAGDEARYRRFLDYDWLADKPDVGVLIEDDGIRGFIGAIYSDRTIKGEHHRLCNLTSIAVDESHRKLTLQLFGSLLKRKELTFTCFSASEQVAKILDFFKFAHRPGEKVIVTPLTGLGALRDVLRVRTLTNDACERELGPEERQIARDHGRYRCGRLLVTGRDRQCFVVSVRRGRDVRAFADILYASDPAFLVEHLPWIQLPLLRAHQTVLTGLDRRWFASLPRGARVYSKLRPIYMRSTRLGLDDIDALYSELVPAAGTRAS